MSKSIKEANKALKLKIMVFFYINGCFITSLIKTALNHCYYSFMPCKFTMIGFENIFC